MAKNLHPEDGPIFVTAKAAQVPAAPITSAPPPPAKAKPLREKKATPPPKPQAPAQPAAGAQETNSAAPPTQTPSPSVAPSSGSRETSADAVARILGDSIDEADAKALADAIDLAREGDAKALEGELKELSGITQADKKALREAGKSLAPAARGEAQTDVPTEAPYVVEDAFTEAARVKENIQGKTPEEALVWVAANGPNKAYRYIAAMVLKKLRALQGRGAEFKLGFKYLRAGEGGVTSTKTGPYTNGKRLSFQVAITLTTNMNNEVHGTSFETVLHEYVHAVTAAQLHFGRKNIAPSAFKVSSDLTALYKFVKAHMAHHKLPLPKGLERSNALHDADELLAWGLTDKDFQNLLARIPYGKAQSAWSKLVQIVRDALGISSEYESALDRLMTISEELLAPDLDAWITEIASKAGGKDFNEAIATSLTNYARRGPEPPKPISVSTLQRLGETMANSTYGLERTEQEVRKLGKVVPVDESPYYAGRKYTSDRAEIAGIDNEEIITPISVWIAKNWRKFGDSLAEFHKRSDEFFQAHHQLHERLPDLWRQYVPLEAGQDFARDLLIDQANEGKITPTEFYTKLRELVAQHKTMSLNDWAVKNGLESPAILRKRLEALDAKGYNEKTMAEYNAMFEPARKRLQEHMEASGRISPTDPWVKARGWKWYFPLKGDAKVADFAADADYGSYKGTIRPFKTRGLETMEGRTTRAASVAEQLITDMNQEGEKRAEGEFKAALFAFYESNKDLMGASKLTVIKGTPKQGFTKTVYKKNAQGKRVAVEVSVPAKNVFVEPASGFVFHNGDTHLRVELDPSNEIAGQLDRGIKGFRNVHSPKHPALKAMGAVTNFMARTYTTYSPEWQFFVGFARDLNYIPTTLAVELFDSPLEAGKFARGYAKRVFANTAGTFNLARTLKELGGRKDLLSKRLADDKFLQQLHAYRAAGGSTEFAQSLNPEIAYSLLFGKAERRGLKSVPGKVYGKLNDLTSNWAQLLENKGRVAAFTTLVEDLGMDPKEAAARVKGVMDFGQSGEYGRMVNAWLAFYRVGATGTDVMRRAFTTPTGTADWPKLAKWSTFFAGLGAAAYMLAAAALGDDEDGVPRIKKYDINTLTAKLVLPGENTTGYAIGLGLPQLLLAPGIIGAALTNEHVDGTEATNAMYEVLTRNAPLQPAGWAEGTGPQGFVNSWMQGVLVPTAGRPLMETTTNTNAFDAAIHTTFKNPKKFRSEQGMGVTPKEWKEAAIFLRESTGIDMYPEDIRHMSKGYLGQALSTVMRHVADNENAENAGLDSQPVRGALRLKLVDEDFYYNRELKKALKALNNTKNRQDAAKNAGTEAEFNANPENSARLSALNMLEKAKKRYYDDLTRIRESDMSIEGKRTRRKLADSALRQAVERAQGAVELDD
jgi:hypothetical protein